jgi:ATP-dependent DNA helicase RecG
VNFRKNYLLPALKAGFLEMTIPGKPQSNKQRYRLTEEGKCVVETLGKGKRDA